MRYLFVALIGLALGTAAAGAVLYYNPFADKSAPMPIATDRVLHYSLPDQVMQFAVGEDARLFGQDTGWRIAGPLPEATDDLADLEHLESRAIRASLELAATRSTLDAAARRACG